MSISALLRGCERRLREVFNDQPDEPVGKCVGIQPGDGRPPRNWGQFYASIRWGGGRNASQNPNLYVDDYHAVIVTLTARLNYVPGDRKGAKMTTPPPDPYSLDTALGFYDLVGLLARDKVIHGCQKVLTYANQFIPGTSEYVAIYGGDATVNGFIEQLVLGPYGPERLATSDWVGTDKPVKDVYVTELRFNEARRIQTLTEE